MIPLVDENTLYYTFSTIAQTLAGTVAVLVAFVLFRLSKLDDAISQGRTVLRSKVAYFEEAWQTLSSRGPEALDALVQEKGGSSQKAAEGWESYVAAHGALQNRAVVTCRLYAALGVTVVDIAVCFLALAFTKPLACSAWSAALVLALAVTLGVCVPRAVHLAHRRHGARPRLKLSRAGA